ncbi:histidine phosphatase family protein [Luteibacter yeojuensis]|uniref:Fructose-2,6-bisphosphatase n=1 Tax=Luteibacter yeojuensis TaxID=345309 RepID=A0A0F3KQS4_9GAMM|nr:histidine phosphatase family protein [Luteibacter yeojuensis]KJV33322.1 fructose-2,6-bisphosphatase [Luteibacter yeojuensis]
MSIHLLRHGDTGQAGFRGQLDDPLSALGWSQLRAAVEGQGLDRIVTSPLARCARFAEELAAARGVPLRIDARLAEYHFGEWQGVPVATLAEEQGEALGRFWADPVTNPPPGAETIPAFHARLAAAMDTITAEAPDARVLVVTHGGAIRLLRCVAEGRPLADMASIDVPHASLHAIPWKTACAA